MLPPCCSTIDRQIDRPMPRPSGFVVKKALKQSVHILRLDSGAGVLDRNKYVIGSVLLRSYPQLVTAARHGTRGLDAVHQKIHQDLL